MIFPLMSLEVGFLLMWTKKRGIFTLEKMFKCVFISITGPIFVSSSRFAHPDLLKKRGFIVMVVQ